MGKDKFGVTGVFLGAIILILIMLVTTIINISNISSILKKNKNSENTKVNTTTNQVQTIEYNLTKNNTEKGK